jgi:hypothetical protein
MRNELNHKMHDANLAAEVTGEFRPEGTLVEDSAKMPALTDEEEERARVAIERFLSRSAARSRVRA